MIIQLSLSGFAFHSLSIRQCTIIHSPSRDNCKLLCDHVTYGVRNLTGCSTGGIFPHSDRPMFPCQLSLLRAVILHFTVPRYFSVLTAQSVNKCFLIPYDIQRDVQEIKTYKRINYKFVCFIPDCLVCRRIEISSVFKN